MSCQYPKTNRNSIRLLTHLIYSFSNERNLELEKDSFEGFGGSKGTNPACFNHVLQSSD